MQFLYIAHLPKPFKSFSRFAPTYSRFLRRFLHSVDTFHTFLSLSDCLRVLPSMSARVATFSTSVFTRHFWTRHHTHTHLDRPLTRMSSFSILISFDSTLFDLHSLHFDLQQGICSLHRLDNVTLFDVPSAESVVANNANASTVAFIAPNKNVLYVGVSYAGKSFKSCF